MYMYNLYNVYTCIIYNLHVHLYISYIYTFICIFICTYKRFDKLQFDNLTRWFRTATTTLLVLYNINRLRFFLKKEIEFYWPLHSFERILVKQIIRLQGYILPLCTFYITQACISHIMISSLSYHDSDELRKVQNKI